MNDYYKNRKYFVYRHVAPNGKMYIGITSRSAPELRWGVGGKFYAKSNTHFWCAIQKYGWENIKHIIVAHGLGVVQACNLEAYLIKKYDTLYNGYNQTSGGVTPTEITKEVRNRISNKVIAYHSSLPSGYWSNKFKGHVVSEHTRHKISAKSKGRTYTQEVIDKRRQTFINNLTPNRRYKFGGANRGRKLSDKHVEKIRCIHKGKHLSMEQRINISRYAKARFSIKHVWVHKLEHELEVPETKLSWYLDQGYILGRCNIKNIYLTKAGTTIKVSAEHLDKYLDDGWIYGFSQSRISNIRKSKQKYLYTYKNMQFYTGSELAAYLRTVGYPKIVQGTINSICQGSIIKSYPELSIEIHRRLVDESI